MRRSKGASRRSSKAAMPTKVAAWVAALGGLVSNFEQAGLGHLVQSWISNGPNQPVSPQQLQSVFGENQVQIDGIAIGAWRRRTSCRN